MDTPEQWSAKEAEAWKRFSVELDRLAIAAQEARLAGERKRTLRSLAEEMGASEDLLKYWRFKRRKPPITQLPKIAEVLRAGASEERSHDPLYFFHLLGVIPAPPPRELQERVVDVAFRLQKMQLDFAQAQDDAGTYGRRGGSTAILKAALASERWGVAIWPAFEGPDSCMMKVSDRIDFTRLDPDDRTPLTAGEVWADPLMRKALRAAYALRTSRTPRWATFTDRPTSQWSVPHIGSPMAPLVEKPYPGAPSIALSSITNASWVNDVASILALVIGYGLSTTRDLAMDIGEPSPEMDVTSELKLMVHGRWLQMPPLRRCWSHHSVMSGNWENPFTYPGEGSQSEAVVHVWLEEDNDLLSRWADFTPPSGLQRPTQDALIAEKERILEQVQVLKRDHPLIHLKVRNLEAPGARWEQVLSHVMKILDTCIEQDFLPRNLSYAHTLASNRDPGLVFAVSNWLVSRGCKAVFDRPDR